MKSLDTPEGTLRTFLVALVTAFGLTVTCLMNRLNMEAMFETNTCK